MDIPEAFPTFEVEFSRRGEVHDPSQVAALADHLKIATPPVTDLIVISHGWNNDIADARKLYSELFANIDKGRAAGWASGTGNRTYAVLAIYWPSKRFADEELIPGGAASADGLVSTGTLEAQIDDLHDVFDTDPEGQAIERLKALAVQLEDSPEARKEFGEQLRSLLARSESGDEEMPSEFWTKGGDELLEALSTPLGVGVTPPAEFDFESGGAADVGNAGFDEGGSAAGIFEGALSGVKAAARRLMNLATYWEMKDRSGIVGTTGVNPILRGLKQDHPSLGLHLIGHSFGARVVTASVAGSSAGDAAAVDSMTLLQAAFSHYGFAEDYEADKDGFFRRVVADGLVSGPILISHSVKDTAVGLAYPLASRIAGQVAAAVGDANDKYGGLGRNGAQKTPEASNIALIVPGSGAYTFATKSVNNLNGDVLITGHSDVRGEAVAFAVLAAIAAT